MWFMKIGRYKFFEYSHGISYHQVFCSKVSEGYLFLWLTPLHQPCYFVIYILKLFKFVHFPAIELQYDEKQLKFVSATFLWTSGLILQIVTTLSSAYSVFNVIIDRLFIYKIKVFSIINLHKHLPF